VVIEPRNWIAGMSLTHEHFSFVTCFALVAFSRKIQGHRCIWLAKLSTAGVDGNGCKYAFRLDFVGSEAQVGVNSFEYFVPEKANLVDICLLLMCSMRRFRISTDLCTNIYVLQMIPGAIYLLSSSPNTQFCNFCLDAI
jgi:hypothetical protein